MRFPVLAPALLFAAGICSSCDAGSKPGAAQRAPISAPSGSVGAASGTTPARFSAADGTELAGDFFPADDPTLPALVLVHRLGGDRHEWQPLEQLLARAKRRYSILAFDLSGSGQSKAHDTPDASPITAGRLFKSDVEAALAYVTRVSKPRSMVLVGSSLGATLVCEVAFETPKVTALALISPGAAIAGEPLYPAYAEVRNLPTFIAAAREDDIAREPVNALSKMALAAAVKQYSGTGHAAGFLGELHPEFWQDLENWLMSAYDETPRERRSLYYAEGKQPARRRSEKSSGHGAALPLVRK